MLSEATPRPTHSRILGLTMALLAVAFVAFFARTGDAKAGLAWCASDPIISVNGQEISIWINVPAERVGAVEEAVIEIHVPRNVSADVVFVDQTFFPEKVVIKKDLPAWNKHSGPMLITGEIEVDAEGEPFAVAVEVIDAAGSQWYDGSSNQDISFTARATQ